MKRLVLLVLGLLYICSLCACDLVPYCPYGKWESTEIGFVMDIDPSLVPEGTEVTDWPGTLDIDGETVDVVVKIHIPTQSLRAYYYPDDQKDDSGELEKVECLAGSYGIRDGELRLSLTLPSQEKYGAQYAYFDLIEVYDVPERLLSCYPSQYRVD